jgi:hypothetical protein
MHRFNIVDQQSDRSQAYLYKALDNYSNADQIKSACLEGYTTDGMAKMASNEFAFPEFRAFPVDSMESTILSKVYFDTQNESKAFHAKLASYLPQVEAKLYTFLDLFNVPKSIFEKKAQVKKTASEFEERYLLPSKKMCKVASVQDLADASDLFSEHLDKLDIPTRIEFSQNYVKIASEVKHRNFSAEIAKYAAELDTNLACTQRYLELRAAAAQRAHLDRRGDEYLKLASQLKEVNLADASKDDMKKLAHIIYALDKSYGIENSKKMPDAYSVVFNKEANDPATTVNATDDLTAKTMSKADVIGKYGIKALSSVENPDGTLDTKRLAEMNKMKQIFNQANQSNPALNNVSNGAATGAIASGTV